MSGGYRIEPLADHDRTSFDSGSEDLDRYFRERVTQDVRRRVATCFVAIGGDGRLAGFYTLAATSLAFDLLSAERIKKLPRYPVVPAILLGRLAIARADQGKRLGSALLADALLRTRSLEVGAHFMVVDAKNEGAALFYEHLEFVRLAPGALRLLRPL